MVIASICDNSFLSRLCGGECEKFIFHAAHSFLSRLCGGEFNTENEAFQAYISKPPVWR